MGMGGWEGGDGDLPCFVMRENFLIIFIQIFLINSLIFFGRSAGGRAALSGSEMEKSVIKLFY